MNDLQIIIEGTSRIHDLDIPNIYGGFGPKQKAITDKTIAELHDKEVKVIRQNIKNNIKQFEKGVDYIDLKQVNLNDLFLDLGYAKAQWGNSKNIYLLSERGYMKLIKIMDTQLAWDIYNELLEDYFYYKEKDEITFQAEALDRIENGFNYKEIEFFIEDNSLGVAEFEIKELSKLIPSGRYPKGLIKMVLETTDTEIDKILKNIDSKTMCIRGKNNIKAFLSDNAISYTEKGAKILINNIEYSTSVISFCDDEDVINIVLSLQNNKRAKEIRTNLLKKELIAILPINNVTLTEKEKELTALCDEQRMMIQDLKNSIDISNAKITDLTNAINKLDNEKQTAYDEGFKAGQQQAKKNKAKSIFKNIKDTVKKWIGNKAGGEKEPQKSSNVVEYPDVNSNRIRPTSNPETKDIGRFVRVEESDKNKQNRLRKEINDWVQTAAKAKNKTSEQMWTEIHTQVSNNFRNGAYIRPEKDPKRPQARPSKINSYNLEELEFATNYCIDIIEKSKSHAQ